MADGTAAAPPAAGTPAPTSAPAKGATSPSATANPGTSAATPTPQGATGTPTTPPAGPKTPWGDGKLKVPLKFEGKEEFAEFGSVEELQRELQLAKLAGQSRRQALEHEKRMKSLEEAAAKSPEDLMRALGINFDDLFKSRLESELSRAQMSEEQRKLADFEKAKTAAEKKAEAAERQLRARLEHEQEERVWAEMEPRLRAAMTEAGMIGDEASMEEIASVALEFNEAGLHLAPEEVVKEAAARQRERFDKRLATFTADDWQRRIPEEVMFELSKRFVEKIRKARAPQAQPVTPFKEKPKAQPSAMSEYLDLYEARAKGIVR